MGCFLKSAYVFEVVKTRRFPSFIDKLHFKKARLLPGADIAFNDIVTVKLNSILVQF